MTQMVWWIRSTSIVTSRKCWWRCRRWCHSTVWSTPAVSPRNRLAWPNSTSSWVTDSPIVSRSVPATPCSSIPYVALCNNYIFYCLLFYTNWCIHSGLAWLTLQEDGFIEYFNTIVVQPHKKLVTNQGRGYHVRCRYQTKDTAIISGFNVRYTIWERRRRIPR